MTWSQFYDLDFAFFYFTSLLSLSLSISAHKKGFLLQMNDQRNVLVDDAIGALRVLGWRLNVTKWDGSWETDMD